MELKWHKWTIIGRPQPSNFDQGNICWYLVLEKKIGKKHLQVHAHAGGPVDNRVPPCSFLHFRILNQRRGMNSSWRMLIINSAPVLNGGKPLATPCCGMQEVGQLSRELHVSRQYCEARRNGAKEQGCRTAITIDDIHSEWTIQVATAGSIDACRFSRSGLSFTLR